MDKKKFKQLFVSGCDTCPALRRASKVTDCFFDTTIEFDDDLICDDISTQCPLLQGAILLRLSDDLVKPMEEDEESDDDAEDKDRYTEYE